MYQPQLKQINLKDKILKIVALSNITESNVSHLITLIRKFIEKNNLKGSYPALDFYADWAVHVELNRKTAISVLKKIDDFLSEDTQHPFIQGVEFLNWDFLSLEKLRIEMKSLLDLAGIDSTITKEEARWSVVWGHFLDIMSDCPLKFPTDINKKIISQLEICYTETKPSYACFAATLIDGTRKILPVLRVSYNSGLLEDDHLSKFRGKAPYDLSKNH